MENIDKDIKIFLYYIYLKIFIRRNSSLIIQLTLVNDLLPIIIIS